MAGDILVLADIHVGLDREMFKVGVRMGSIANAMADDIVSLVEEYTPSRVLLIGDIKHGIPGAEDEMKDTSEFLERLAGHVPVTIIPGNHDGNISRLITSEDILIAPSGGIVVDGMGFFHGHSWPLPNVVEQETVFMAHQHPCIELSENIGGRHRLSVWCISGFSKAMLERYQNVNLNAKVVLMPAFNPLVSGTPLNLYNATGLLGPIMKNKMFKLKQSNVYLLDGTPLGKLSSIKGAGSRHKEG
ncbi:MAG: metallophosphoesterase [Candidatus Micrarchaeota archaeon]